MAPLVPLAECNQRLGALRSVLVTEGIDVALIVEAADLYYLAGAVADAHLIVFADQAPVFMVRRDVSRAIEDSPLERVEAASRLQEVADRVRVGCRRPARIGLELDVLPAAQYLRYAKFFPDAQLVDIAAPLRRIRARKSAWEVDRIRLAAEQLRVAHAAVPDLLAASGTDLELQIELERVLRRNGHQGPFRFRGLNGDLFFGAVLAGADGAVPAYSDTPLGGPGPSPAVGRGARGARIRPGDSVIVDLVGAADGYLADATRTFSCGMLDDDLAAAQRVCVEMLAACEPLLVAGGSWAAPFDQGQRIATDAGFGDFYMGRVRFVGHGVGLEMNEPPFLAAGQTALLEEGHVVAVEPKIIIPGRGAVGIENTYLIGDGPPENLTEYP